MIIIFVKNLIIHTLGLYQRFCRCEIVKYFKYSAAIDMTSDSVIQYSAAKVNKSDFGNS